MSCPWSGAGDSSCHPWPLLWNFTRWHFGILFRLEFSTGGLNPGFWDTPKAPVSTGNGKEGRWLILVLSCKIIQATVCKEAGYNLIPHFSDKSGQVAQVDVVFQCTAVARFFFLAILKKSSGPRREPMCSPPPSMLLFLDGGTKATEDTIESCGYLCCFPRNLFQNV